MPPALGYSEDFIDHRLLNGFGFFRVVGMDHVCKKDERQF